MKIDIFAHILPPGYVAAFAKKNPNYLEAMELRSRATCDLKVRLKLMDRYEGVLQVLTIANPPLDVFVSPEDAIELARIANDELAEIVDTNPDKFIAGVACVPMNNIDAALVEADRAINKLGLKGIQICTRVKGEPLDQPQFRPLWEKMVKHDLPIWLHPYDNPKLDPDGGRLTWPFETATAMYRLVTSGIFDDFPGIKFITHHCGSMIPHFGKRIPRPDQFRKFYNDTAVYGNTDALMLGYAFFGADHILFGTDAPLGPKNGLTWQTMKSVEEMNIPDIDKEKIFIRNAIDLLRLSI
jgi:predicted TIM-barrel fold metal-dependent hydrolase